MELKSYQRDVLKNLRRYLELISQTDNYAQAYFIHIVGYNLTSILICITTKMLREFHQPMSRGS